MAWSFRESSTINPVVAELLRIRSLVNRQFCVTPSVFYHPGHLNTMADDASQKFELDLTNFIYLLVNLFPSPVSRFLAHLPPAFKDCFRCDLRLAQTCVRGRHIASDKSARKYQDWMDFCAKMQIDHTLEDPEVPIMEVLQVFGIRVHGGSFSNRVCIV